MMIAVNDSQLMSSWRDMARIGVFMEPTSALAVAGAWLAKGQGQLKDEEEILVVVTGHGLKTPTNFMSGMGGASQDLPRDDPKA